MAASIMVNARLPNKAKEHLAKARESCLGAVAAYNNPTAEFRSGTYIVLIIIAWISLLHAIFYRDGVKPWRIKSGTGKGTRYKRRDSEYWHWELGECLRQYYKGEYNPIRANLQFLNGLRDRIEHRNMPELDHEVFGECQAALQNFEALLTGEFGERQSLNASLAFSLQFSGILPEARRKAMESLRRSGADSVVNYVQQFRSELAPEVANEQQFAFKVFLIPQLANHRTNETLAVEWIPLEEYDPATREAFNHAIVLLKPQHVPVPNLDNMRPGKVVEEVGEQIPWRFRPYEHTQCWKHFSVRPSKGKGALNSYDSRYCLWDPVFHEYVYTKLWVDKLVSELADEAQFRTIVGKAPVPKPDLIY